MNTWIGIDCGFSQLSVSVLDTVGNTIAHRQAHEPLGDGHDRQVALARLHANLSAWRPPLQLVTQPAILAGYCYDHSGVQEAFLNAGWPVAAVVPLNDVVGVYGLTDMRGHAVLAGCGSFSQVVYVDRLNNICWPSDAAAAALPTWPLSGDAYSQFVQRTYGNGHLAGQLLSELLGRPETQHYLHEAAQTIRTTRDLFWQWSGQREPPRVIVGGGSVNHPALWAQVKAALPAHGLLADDVERVVGDQAAGLARYAMQNRDANAWMSLGDSPPSWLAER